MKAKNNHVFTFAGNTDSSDKTCSGGAKGHRVDSKEERHHPATLRTSSPLMKDLCPQRMKQQWSNNHQEGYNKGGKYDEKFFHDWIQSLRVKKDQEGYNKGGKYDEKFFHDWIQSLRVKLEPILPDLMPNNTKDTFEQTCRAVQAALAVFQQAAKLRDQIAKQKPVNQAELDNANKVVESAKKSLDEAIGTCQGVAASSILKELQSSFLSKDFDDSDLVTFMALTEAGEKSLAEWCNRGEEETKQILTLFHDTDLLRQFLQAGSPKKGQYAQAIELYSHMHAMHSSPNNNDPVLQRLALAVALELAAPIDRKVNEGKDIDPLHRYVHYEQAYLFGVLDPAFSQFTVWEMRHAVNSDAPDEEIGWGRECLMNYRPDLALMDDEKWRYCRIVRTDVAYKNPEWYKPRPSYDQILSGGGKCGPRAWYGRFICKAFGIPTWGVKQPGHAAMSRWTPEGWVTCLGAGFNVSWWDDGCCGNNFLLETQARSAAGSDEAYMQQVMRLEWVAAFHGESKRSVETECMPDPKSLWYAVSLMQRKQLASNNRPSTLRLPASRLEGKTRIEKLLKQPQVREPIARDDRDGTVIIPATACSSPTKNTQKVLFMKSFLGGRQLFIGKDAVVEYTLAPDILPEKPTKYKLTCYINTVHRHEDPMLLTVAAAKKNATIIESTVQKKIKMPYTMGMWEETEPVEVELGGSGITSTKLSFARQMPQFGISVKFIKLVAL